VSKLREIVEVNRAPRVLHGVAIDDRCGLYVVPTGEGGTRGPNVCDVFLSRAVDYVQSFSLLLKLHLLLLPPLFFKHNRLEVRNSRSAVLPCGCGRDRRERTEGVLPRIDRGTHPCLRGGRRWLGRDFGSWGGGVGRSRLLLSARKENWQGFGMGYRYSGCGRDGV